MRFLIERYKDLYEQNRINIEYLDLKLKEGKINQEEYDYIIKK